MPRTTINCPNCRQPITADINQLFDVRENPAVKQIILSGAFNLAQCPHCGYQGNLATPIVYHDPEKELLLTYFPPELNLPVNEQERIIGPILKRVMDNLPQEKRKAYLLRPQSMLTMQTMTERILLGDGITKEMIEAQQKRINLLGRMLDASEDALDEIIKTDHDLFDGDFFTILSQLFEAASSSGDENAVESLGNLQQTLLEKTEFGQQIQSQSNEFQAAVQTLEELGDSLTREKLLELFIDAPNDLRLSVYVSMTRPGIDYEFYQLLSSKIDQAEGEKRQSLLDLRNKLLELTQSIDKELESRQKQAGENLNKILSAQNIKETMQRNLAAVDDFFLQSLAKEKEAARGSGDLERIGKLNEVESVIREASKPPKEMELIQALLEAENEEAQIKILEENRQQITPEFLQAASSVLGQAQAGEDKDFAAIMENLYRVVLRFSMKMNL